MCVYGEERLTLVILINCSPTYFVCLCVHVHVDMHVRGRVIKRVTLSVFHLVPELWSLTEPEAHQCLEDQQAPRIPLSQPLLPGIIGVNHNIQLYVGTKDQLLKLKHFTDHTSFQFLICTF